jgi:hypothetical protein
MDLRERYFLFDYLRPDIQSFCQFCVDIAYEESVFSVEIVIKILVKVMSLFKGISHALNRLSQRGKDFS